MHVYLSHPMKQKMEEDSLVVCILCGNGPCLTALTDEYLISEGYRYRMSNDARNKQVSFRLHNAWSCWCEQSHLTPK